MEDLFKTVETAAAEKPDVDPARTALVKEWTKKVRASKKHFEADFKRMRTNMKLAEKGGPDEQVGGDRYVANITNRFVNQKVAQLYARNPRVVAKRRRRLEFKVWDGRPESLQEAMQQVMGVIEQAAAAGVQGMDPMMLAQQFAPQAVALIMDVQEGQTRQRMIDRVGKTLEILTEYFMDEGTPTFKTQAKQLVRRTEVCSVGYIKLNFQRLLKPDPSIEQKLHDASMRLNLIEKMMEDAQESDFDVQSAQAEQLRLMIADLQSQPQIVAREGLVFDFPRSTAIIVDKECKQLTGFIGARWIAHEMIMTPDKVKEQYKVDVKSGYTSYKPDGADKTEGEGESFALIWEIQCKDTGLVYTVCDGYCDFLEEPRAPDVWLSGFWNIRALTFNDIESESRVYPLSDVELIQPMQEEYNRGRQGLREHRARNRPGWIAARGTLDDVDKAALASNTVNAIVELNALQQGDAVSNVLQPKPTAPVDPNLYDVNQAFSDIQRTAGMSETHLGELTGATATETSVGEQSRVTAASSDVDNLDSFLSDVARAAGEILLVEMNQESVMEIAGPGAVWPEQSRQEIATQVYLSVKAGSSGRPNKAQELANFERAAPWLVQVPGINPKWFGRRALETLWEDTEIEEAIADGMPSITAMNSMAGKMLAGPSTGDPSTDPAQQGGEGGQNAPNPQKRPPGAQPAYPAA